MDLLCLDYISTKCYSRISAIHTAVGEVAKALSCASPAWTANNDPDLLLKTRVRDALNVIEDLLLPAMEDKDIAGMRQQGVFLYQSLTDGS